MDDIIDRHAGKPAKCWTEGPTPHPCKHGHYDCSYFPGGPCLDETLAAEEAAKGHAEVLEDKRRRAEAVILDIASREPSCPYPRSLALTCVERLVAEGLL